MDLVILMFFCGFKYFLIIFIGITFIEEGTCQMKGAIWKLPEIKEYTNDILQLNKLADIDTTPYGTDLKTIVYHPIDCKKIVSVVDNNFALWDLTNKGPQVLIISSFVQNYTLHEYKNSIIGLNIL